MRGEGLREGIAMQEANVIYSTECGSRKWSRKRKVPNGAVVVVGRCKVRWHGIPWKITSCHFFEGDHLASDAASISGFRDLESYWTCV